MKLEELKVIVDSPGWSEPFVLATIAQEWIPKLIAVAEAAPKGCICHVSSFDGLYGSKHSERCQRYLDALAALEAD